MWLVPFDHTPRLGLLCFDRQTDRQAGWRGSEPVAGCDTDQARTAAGPGHTRAVGVRDLDCPAGQDWLTLPERLFLEEPVPSPLPGRFRKSETWLGHHGCRSEWTQAPSVVSDQHHLNRKYNPSEVETSEANVGFSFSTRGNDDILSSDKTVCNGQNSVEGSTAAQLSSGK